MTIANTDRRFFSLAISAALLIFVLSLGSVPVAHAQQNLIYINGNITVTGQNAVIALVNDGAGNLTSVPGSPFPTGGTGVAGTGNPLADAQWDSDGEVMLNKAGTLLFAVNGHSNNISAFKLNANGTLTAVAGSPFASGGTQPASIGYKDNALGNGVSIMMVANKDSDPFQTATRPSYTSFTVSSDGVLTMNAGSTTLLPAGSSPAQVLVRNSGPPYFFGVLYFGKRISSYKMSRAGIMTRISSMATPFDAVGAVFHPIVKAIYLTLPPNSQVNVYGYDTTGKLSSAGTATNQGMAVCWAATNAAGTRLYTAETLSGTISVYDITNSKTPVQLQHLAVSADGGTAPLPSHMKIDPTGKFLYVLDRNGFLHVFDVAADGTVTENHAPFNLGLPASTVPLDVAVLMK
ncbi:MAG: lactonase family protein [Acidobacteriia bacterium]|nr:lactonase family protein [Terriglobia bacterium]